MKQLLFAAMVATVFAAPALAHDVKAGPLILSDLYVRAPIGEGKNTAAYLTATNPTGEPDRLVSVSCACAAEAELHDMSVANGVMRMRKAPFGFEVPSGGALVLAPGGKHIMLTGLKQTLKDGERVDLVLEFSKAGKVKADFHVVSQVPTASAAGHRH
jgi:copper(I)-binding protein